MNRSMISTALAGLLLSAGAALAQPDDHHDRGHGDQHGGPPPAALNAPAPPAAPATAPVPGNPGAHIDFHPGNVAAMDQRSVVGRRPGADQQAAPNQAFNRGNPPSALDRRDATDHRFSTGQQGAPAAGNSDFHRGFDNRDDRRGRTGPSMAMRGPDRDFSSFHRNFSSPRRFHASTYQRPRGWYAHRWTFGERLPTLFWTQNYWLSDYFDFGLTLPPPGTVWVRDGSDALLIDQYDGQIIQVAYDVFY